LEADGALANLLRQESEIKLLLLWFGILGGPTAWVFHIGLSYLSVPFVCTTGLVIVLHVITALAALGAGASAAVAVAAWWLNGGAEETDLGGVRGRTAFMSVVGIMMSLLFLLVILVESTGNYYLPACELRLVLPTEQ
jgi:hypothetical protein